VATLAIAVRLFVTHNRVLAFGWIGAQAGGLNVLIPLLAASSWRFPRSRQYSQSAFRLTPRSSYFRTS
jgi:hypothetical protein